MQSPRFTDRKDQQRCHGHGEISFSTPDIRDDNGEVCCISLRWFHFAFLFFSSIGRIPSAKIEIDAEEIELDREMYKRAVVNDFFSRAFGPSESELKPNQAHSVRSSLESIAGGFIRSAPEKRTARETLTKIKEEMRKKKIRIEQKDS